MKNITLLIPTYNRANLLNKCLESVFAQDFQGNIHCIISNNNSPDSTNDVIESWSKKQDKFKITHIDNKDSLSPIDNWEKTLRFVDTKYTKFLQDDDWLEPNALSTMSDDLKKFGAEVLVYNANIYSKDNNFKPIYSYYRGNTKKLDQADIINSVLQLGLAYPTSPTASIMKFELIKKALQFGKSNQFCTKNLMGNDLIFNFLGLFEGENTYFVNKPIVNFYGGEDSISLSFNPHELNFCYIKSLALLIEKGNTQLTVKQLEIIQHRIFTTSLRSIFDTRLKNINGIDGYRGKVSINETLKFIKKRLQQFT